MEAWIGECLESVLTQKDAPLEIIVINDGSTDGSEKVISSFKDHIHYLSGENQGVNPARDWGYEKANGRYCLFLDADDILEKHSLKPLYEGALNENADICYGDWKSMSYLSDTTPAIKTHHSGSRTDFLVARFLDWEVHNNSLIYKKEFLDQHALRWTGCLGHPDDVEYQLKVLVRQPRVHYVPGCVGYYRLHRENTDVTRARYELMIINIVKMLQRTEILMRQNNLWREPYISALCGYYLRLAKEAHGFNKKEFSASIQHIQSLNPETRPGQPLYRFLVSFFGYNAVENVLGLRRKIRKLSKKMI